MLGGAGLGNHDVRRGRVASTDQLQVGDEATLAPIASPTAVALLAHGSKRGTATELGMHAIRQRLQDRLPQVLVGLAFFEFLHPTLEELVREFAGRGIARVVVQPYFLFDGKEITLDIPEELERVAAAVPGVALAQAGSLGVDDRLVDHVARRVEGALRGLCQYKPVAGRLPSTRDRGTVGVVLCNRGSRRQYDPGDRLRELCAALSARLGQGTLVEPAQAENGGEDLTIEAAARRLVAAGTERVVVVPYLHFPGKVLFVNIAPAVQKAQAEHPLAKFYLAWTLCANDAAIDICVDRILQTGLIAPPSA
jgi:sirohydrochlorin ferrochelatase